MLRPCQRGIYRARGNGIDKPVEFGGRDERVPPIFVFVGSLCRRNPLVGSSAQRWNSHFASVGTTSVPLREVKCRLTSRSMRTWLSGDVYVAGSHW
jgi:hypothetical protein